MIRRRADLACGNGSGGLLLAEALDALWARHLHGWGCGREGIANAVVSMIAGLYSAGANFRMRVVRDASASPLAYLKLGLA